MEKNRFSTFWQKPTNPDYSQPNTYDIIWLKRFIYNYNNIIIATEQGAAAKQAAVNKTAKYQNLRREDPQDILYRLAYW